MAETKLPVDSSCQAEYEDGFILDETQLDDTYPEKVEIIIDDYDENHKKIGEHVELVYKNVFHAILNRLPEAEHGKMVRFAVFWKDRRYDVDWRGLPESARPIRFRDGSNTWTAGEEGNGIFNGFHAVRFGYQYNDETGKNLKIVQELV